MREHTTHFDDCGCLSARLEKELARKDEIIQAYYQENQRLGEKMQKVFKNESERWSGFAEKMKGLTEGERRLKDGGENGY